MPKKRAAPDDDAAPSKRIRIPSYSGWLASLHLKYADRPTYKGASEKKAGGSEVKAKLGPKSNKGMGTDANPKLPRGIEEVRKKFPKETWIAGHLLNADVGGDGNEPNNMAVLTSSTNALMKSQESALKDGVDYLSKVYEAIHAAGIFDPKEISISVTVTATHHDSLPFPDCYIARTIKQNASLNNKNSFSIGDIKLGEENRKGKLLKDITDALDKVTAALNKANDSVTQTNWKGKA